jgi:hypothetical protein
VNPEITEYIENIKSPWQIDVCNRLRQIILQTVPGVEEVKQYNHPAWFVARCLKYGTCG